MLKTCILPRVKPESFRWSAAPTQGSKPMGLLTTPLTPQAHFHLRALVLAAPPSRTFYPQIKDAFPYFLWIFCHHISKAYLGSPCTPLINVIPSPKYVYQIPAGMFLSLLFMTLNISFQHTNLFYVCLLPLKVKRQVFCWFIHWHSIQTVPRTSWVLNK